MKKPVLGVLTRGTTVKKLLKQQPPSSLLLLEKANRIPGLSLYFFSYREIDTARRVVAGVCFNRDRGAFEQREFPYPDFIYKRGSGIRDRDESCRMAQHLREAGIATLNYEERFNKWEVHRHLAGEKELLPHLPFTRAFSGPEDLQQAFKGRGRLYLKGLLGGRGRKVACAVLRPGGGYEFRYLTDALHVRRFPGFQELLRGILDFFRGGPFLLQEAIELLEVDGRKVDFRAEVQRDREGGLTVTAIPVRVGLRGAPITTHADAYPFADFCTVYLKYTELQLEEFTARVGRFLKIFYLAMEKAYGPMAELGIDFGLDKQGRLWFIEGNSRSAKVSLYKAYDAATILRSNLNILEYAQYRHDRSRAGRLPDG